MSADASVGDKTEKLKFWLGTAAKKQYELVDGSDAEQKELRNKLFDISGKRAVYPQVFIQKEDSISFVGDFEGVEVRHKVRLFEAADASLSPMQSLVESNEELKGLDQALAGVADASA